MFGNSLMRGHHISSKYVAKVNDKIKIKVVQVANE